MNFLLLHLQMLEFDRLLQVEKGDNLPQVICIPCYNATQQLFSFRESCYKTQIKLKNYQEEKIVPNVSTIFV